MLPGSRAKTSRRISTARNLPGVRFVPVYFTPSSNKYQGERVGGVNILLLDREFFDAPELGIELASALHKLYPASST